MGDLEVSRLDLDADEAAAEVDAGDAGGAAAGERVEDKIVASGQSPDQLRRPSQGLRTRMSFYRIVCNDRRDENIYGLRTARFAI
jgi:hypothetical protein